MKRRWRGCGEEVEVRACGAPGGCNPEPALPALAFIAEVKTEEEVERRWKCVRAALSGGARAVMSRV